MSQPNADANPTEGDSADLFERAADEDGPAAEREAARVLSAVEARLFGSAVEVAKVGRFTLLEQIGSGGAGMVWAAYDPRLDRKVALKLLRARTDRSSQATARLIREARVAGRLSHPNIVSVFDVGEYEGSAYLTMEFIDGPDLAHWLGDEDHAAQVVLDVFMQAGRGLAEAHRNGVIHRDFKPANVMVQLGATGPRARVVDFGLAGWDDAATSHPGSAAPSGPPQSGSLTGTGTRMGTPAYMAPEQAAGERATERSDQFSFCVSLVEGLTGRRPFDAVEDYTVSTGVLDDVPAWMRGALERGLSRDADARWPSMVALLAELEPPSSSRRRWGVLAVSVGLLAVAAGIGMQRPTAEDDATCTGAAAELEGIWDDARKSELQAAMEGSGLAYAPEVWERIAPRIDAWTTKWSQMHREACEATHRRREQSEAALDLRMACLRRAKLDLVVTTDLLAGASEEVVENAHELVGRLPSIEPCGDLEALQSDETLPPPDEADRVLEVRRLVAEAAANDEATLLDAALAAIERAEQTADGLDYPPIHSEIWLIAARVHTSRGEFEEAEKLLRNVRDHAGRHQQWDALRSATMMLIDNVGNRQARPAEALAMRDLAVGLSKGSPLDEAEASTILGNVFQTSGDYDEAEAELRKSIELRQANLPAGDPAVAEAQSALASALTRQGKLDEAEVHARASLESRLASLGPHHPSVGTSRVSLATVLHQNGKLDEAESLLEEGLEAVVQALPASHPLRGSFYINLAALAHTRGDLEAAEPMTRAAIEALEASSGRHHPDTVASINNLAMTLAMRGKLDEAETHFVDALQRRIDSLGPQHPDVARSQNNLGRYMQERQRYEDAERHFRAALEIHKATLRETHPEIAASHMALGALLRLREEHEGAEEQFRKALTIREKELGPSHPKVASVLSNLGRTLRTLGRYDEAEATLRRGLKINEAGLEPDNPRIADLWLALGGTLLEAGKPQDAADAFERAQKILDGPGTNPRERGKATFALARALWETRSERKRAREVAQRAAELYREAGAPAAQALLRVESWLEEHPV